MKVWAAVALLAAQVLALFEGDKIEKLTSENFEEKVLKDEENAWVVTFYADWCPYCKTFDEELEGATNDVGLTEKNLKLKFGAIDVMENRDLTRQFGIRRSPTVKIFGKDKEAPEDYAGMRKTKEIVTKCIEFCEENEFVKKEEVVEEKEEEEDK